MKKILLLLLVPAAAWAQNPDTKNFVIKGQLAGLAENSLVTLTNLNQSPDTIVRTTVKNGIFVLRGSIPEPNLYQVNFHATQKKYLLFLGYDNLSIKGDIKNLQGAQVKGSTAHSDFLEMQQIFNPLMQKFNEITERVSMQPNLKRGDSIMLAYTEQLEKINKSIDKFIASKRSSPIASFLLVITRDLEQEVVKMERRYNMLDLSVQKGSFGTMVKDEIETRKIGAIGTEAIEFTQNDTTGKPVALSSFRGKYVLVDFWASWCRPCRMENPNVVAAYHKFKDKNFTVLGVSLDRARDPWIQAIKEDALAWTQVSDLKFWNNEAAQKYRINSIPKNYLIDPAGKIIGKDLRGEDLQSKLCELFGCN